MAVTEFLEAVDKKKKAEEAAAAAAPVSAEVAPAAPAMQTPVATPQQLDQMLACRSVFVCVLFSLLGIVRGAILISF